jgi:hypothetical protein
MPTPTYTPLATVTLGSAASSVTFSSIPATYRDLILVVNGQLASAGQIYLRLNGDTGNNYSWVSAQGQVSNATVSAAYTENKMIAWLANNLDSGTRFVFTTSLMDYSATDKHTTALMRINGTSSSTGLTSMAAGRWANTAAVTTVLVTSNVNISSGATLDLYGVIA